jgi:hypothetical protein
MVGQISSQINGIMVALRHLAGVLCTYRHAEAGRQEARLPECDVRQIHLAYLVAQLFLLIS